LCCFEHPVAFVHPNLGSPGSDHHSATDLLLIFARLGFYPLVLGFACHFYPLYLLVLLLSLALHPDCLVLGRMCLIPPHPLLLGFLLPPALHPVSLDPLRMCPVPLHSVYLIPVFLFLFTALSLFYLIIYLLCLFMNTFNFLCVDC